jgi:hypothetical protein
MTLFTVLLTWQAKAKCSLRKHCRPALLPHVVRMFV